MSKYFEMKFPSSVGSSGPRIRRLAWCISSLLVWGAAVLSRVHSKDELLAFFRWQNEQFPPEDGVPSGRK